MLVLYLAHGAFINPADRPKLRLWIVALASELSQARVVAHEELTLGLGPIRESVVTHP